MARQLTKKAVKKPAAKSIPTAKKPEKIADLAAALQKTENSQPDVNNKIDANQIIDQAKKMWAERFPNVKFDSETIVSIILGAMVIIVLGTLVVSYVRDWRGRSQPTAEEVMVTPEPIVITELPTSPIPEVLPATYTVKQGDSTWTIAEAFYGSAYNYVDIETANALEPDSELNVGQELNIPAVPVRAEAGARSEELMMESAADPGITGPAKGSEPLE